MTMLGIKVVEDTCQSMVTTYQKSSEGREWAASMLKAVTPASLQWDEKLAEQKRGLFANMLRDVTENLQNFQAFLLRSPSTPVVPQPQQQEVEDENSETAQTIEPESQQPQPQNRRKQKKPAQPAEEQKPTSPATSMHGFLSQPNQAVYGDWQKLVMPQLPSGQTIESELKNMFRVLLERNAKQIDQAVQSAKGTNKGNHTYYLNKLHNLLDYYMALLCDSNKVIRRYGSSPELSTPLLLFFLPYDEQILDRAFPEPENRAAMQHYVYCLIGLIMKEFAEYYAFKSYKNNDSKSWTGTWSTFGLNPNAEVGKEKINTKLPELADNLLRKANLYLGQPVYNFKQTDLLADFHEVLAMGYGEVAKLRKESAWFGKVNLPYTYGSVSKKGAIVSGEGDYEDRLVNLMEKFSNKVLALKGQSVEPSPFLSQDQQQGQPVVFK